MTRYEHHRSGAAVLWSRRAHELVRAGAIRGRRFAYVANYVSADDHLLELDADELLTAYEPGLRRINAAFSRDWVRERWLHREPHAQPIVTIGYRDRMPAMDTGIPGLVLANTTQIYPEDRGTNYSVRLGWDAAAALLAQPISHRPRVGSGAG